MSFLEKITVGSINGLTIVLIIVGSIIISGFIIALLNKLFYKVTGRDAYYTCIITGSIGTPIHELGHAIFCLLFFHKIVEIKLYTPSSTDGSLGYVTHTYNKKSFYQRIGNFFIGVGPLILGPLVIYGLMYLLSKHSFDTLNALARFYQTQVPVDALDFVKFIVGGLNVFFIEFFALENFKSITFYVFLVLGMLISIHMNLSRPDIDGALSGLLFTILVLFLLPLVLVLISPSLMGKVSGAILSVGISGACIYVLGILLSFIALLFALIIKIITKIFKK